MSNEKEEQSGSFKVVDRRRFTSSGDAREGELPTDSYRDAPRTELPPVTPAAKSGAGSDSPSDTARNMPASEDFESVSAPRSSKPTPQDDTPREGTPEATKSQIERSYAAEGHSSVEFSEFILSLATQAMVLLGEMPDPHTRQMTMNLEGARQTIDIIGTIEQKTRGNLTTEESHLLGEALATIRLAYVRKSRPAQTSK